MYITRYKDRDPLTEGFIAASQQAGVPGTIDYNGPVFEGVGYLQHNVRRGRRRHAADNYLLPAMKRPNLTIESGALAQRVVLEGRKAVGVVYRKGGEERTVRARREVLLAAGAIQSPQLLELSGIGQRDVLKRAGVEVVHELPGVGENLRDHLHVRISFETKLPVTLNTILRNPLLRAKMGARWLFLGRGLMASSSATSMAIARSRPDLPRPDIKFQLHQLSMASSHYADNRKARNIADRMGLDTHGGFGIGTYVLRPESQGSVHVRARGRVEAAGDPRELSLARARRAHHARGAAHDPESRRAAGARAAHRARNAPGTGRSRRRCAARSRSQDRPDLLPSHRHLPHGERSRGGGRCEPCACTASKGCACATLRSCRRWSARTPTRRRS